MAPTRTTPEDHVAAAAPIQQAIPPQARAPKLRQQRHLSPFWRHFLQMLAAMAVGILRTGANVTAASLSES